MSSSDSSDHEDEFDEIRCYFPPREWEGMSNYEKGSYANAARNYQAMLRAGLDPRKPNFMLNDLERSNRINPPTKPYQPRKPKEPKLSNLAPENVRASLRIHEMFNVEEESTSVTKEEKKDLLYCDECHQDWMGDCPKHGPLKVVADTKVPAGGALGGVRSLATLPPGLSLAGKASKQQGGAAMAASGVWVTAALPRRTLFGPYEGDPVSSKAPAANWMGLVRSETGDAANLRALEYCGRLHFRTTRDIPAGGELLVRLDRKECACEHCGARFVSALLLAQHQRAADACAARRRQQRRAQVDYNKARVVYDVRVLERSEAAQQLRREEAARRHKVGLAGKQASRKAERRSETMERLRQEQLINNPEMARWREQQERKLERRRRRLHHLRFEQARAVVALERSMDEAAAKADEDANGSSGGRGRRASVRAVAEDTGLARLRCSLCAADSAPAFRRLFQLRFHLAGHADAQMAAVPSACPKCFLEPTHRRGHRHLHFFCLACGAGFGDAKPLRDHVMERHAADADVVLPPDDDLLSSEDDDVVEVKQEVDEDDVVEVKQEVGRGYPNEEEASREPASLTASLTVEVAWPVGSPPVVVKEEVVEWDAAGTAAGLAETGPEVKLEVRMDLDPEVKPPEVNMDLDPEVKVKAEPGLKDEMDDGVDVEVKTEQLEMVPHFA